MTLEEIAAAWSGGREDPTCGTRGPRGEYLGPIPGAEHCQWPTVTRGAQWGTVTGSRDSLIGLSSIMWERTLPDSAAVALLADSLGAALETQGLMAYSCPGDGRRWQGPGLGVQFAAIPPAADGRPRVWVIATILPGAIPDLLCPGVPPLPPPELRSPRSAAAL